MIEFDGWAGAAVAVTIAICITVAYVFQPTQQVQTCPKCGTAVEFKVRAGE